MSPNRQSIDAAREQWQTFLAVAPKYPTDGFRGRGIAILSGGLPHIISTWVNLKMLRRTGAPWLSLISTVCLPSLQSCCT